jgi:hypothetical protein
MCETDWIPRSRPSKLPLRRLSIAPDATGSSPRSHSALLIADSKNGVYLVVDASLVPVGGNLTA